MSIPINVPLVTRQNVKHVLVILPALSFHETVTMPVIDGISQTLLGLPMYDGLQHNEIGFTRGTLARFSARRA